MTAESDPIQFAGGVQRRQRHICAFFNSADEEYRVLRSFYKEGIDRGEKASHIVDPELRDEHVRRLAEAGIDVQQAMDSGQMEVLPWKQGYLRGDRFDQGAMLALLEEMLKSGAAAGYPLTRLFGHMEWALQDKPGVDDLMEYEIRINHVLVNYDDIVVCAYDLSKFSASVVMDALQTHPVAIIGGVLQENPFFVPPDQFLREMRERRSLRKSAARAN